MEWKKYIFILLPSFFTSLLTYAQIEIVTPQNQGIAWGTEVHLRIKNCPKESFETRINGKKLIARWKKSPYKNEWFTTVSLQPERNYHVVVYGTCGKLNSSSAVSYFKTTRQNPIEIAEKVADDFISKRKAKKLAWNWGPGIFLHGLIQLTRDSQKSEDYVSYLKTYFKNKRGWRLPKINFADRCTSGLVGYELYEYFKEIDGLKGAGAVYRYLAHSKRNSIGALNHLGTHFYSHFYPQSIWLDSLMVAGIIGLKAALHENDEVLLDWVLSQPEIYANVLQDSFTGLFRHSYRVKRKKQVPSSRTFWLRGNGWVASSLIDMIELTPVTHPKRESLIQIFTNLSYGIAGAQMEMGVWDTVMNRPGYAYTEGSGSALSAYALAKGVRLGILPSHFFDSAYKAYQVLTSRLIKTKNGYQVPDTSWHTHPSGPLGYKMVPRLKDVDYGVGAYLLMATEISKTVSKNPIN